jgi:hypothetical protein
VLPVLQHYAADAEAVVKESCAVALDMYEVRRSTGAPFFVFAACFPWSATP